MSSTSTFSVEIKTPLVDDGPLTSADDFVRAIRSFLANAQAGAARQAAARGAVSFPDDLRLQKANRVLNPSRIVSRPATAPDRTGEFAWLRKHSAEFRGSWVALMGEELLSSGEKLEDVLGEVQSRSLGAKPLIHHIE
jgi:hypothetical protein